MYLDTKGFMDAFRGVKDYSFDGPFGEVETILSQEPEEEQEALRKNFFLDLQVMKARTYEELKDISLQQIIDCIGNHGIFSDMFARTKAVEYFSRFRRISAVRTCRKRRIL